MEEREREGERGKETRDSRKEREMFLMTLETDRKTAT